MKRRAKVALIVVVVLLAIVLGLYLEMSARVQDGYAAWNTTKVVAVYIVNNDGKFPTKWSDLENAHPEFDAKDIQTFRKRIRIDFSKKPPRIEIISGRSPIWNKPNEEINQVIREVNLPENERESIYWGYKLSRISAEQDIVPNP